MGEGFIQRNKLTLAAASGSTAPYGNGLGKVGTILASGVMYVRCDLDPHVAKVDWIVQANGAHSIQKYLSETNCTGCTLTLTDATAVDDGDTFIFNGLTFTAETTEGDAAHASRKWYHASQAAGAADIATLLADPVYGVPGIGAITATAPTTTDVLTIAGGNAPVYHFAQGTSDANEIAFASTTKSGLTEDGAAISGLTTTAAIGGRRYEQWTDGAPYAYLGITNNEASNAITPVIKAVRYWA